MRRLGRIARWAGLALVALAAAFWLSLAPGDPALYPGKSPAAVRIHVADHGWHSGIVIGQAELRAAALRIGRQDAAAAARLRWLSTRFAEAEWIEIGWGDEAFYQSTASIEDLDPWLAMRALFVPTRSVIQVVPGWSDPVTAFARSKVVALDLSEAGFDALSLRLAETIPEPPPSVDNGASLYGLGGFYASALDYHLFRTCNHWVSWLLRGAGVPSSYVPATFSTTLMVELEWRGDLG